jgi:hypothetical protein
MSRIVGGRWDGFDDLSRPFSGTAPMAKPVGPVVEPSPVPERRPRVDAEPWLPVIIEGRAVVPDDDAAALLLVGVEPAAEDVSDEEGETLLRELLEGVQ